MSRIHAARELESETSRELERSFYQEGRVTALRSEVAYFQRLGLAEKQLRDYAVAPPSDEVYRLPRGRMFGLCS